MHKELGWNAESTTCACLGVIREDPTEERGFLLHLKAEQFGGTVAWKKNSVSEGHTKEMCKNRLSFDKAE